MQWLSGSFAWAAQLRIEALRPVDIGGEQIVRADLGNLERSRQHDAPDAVIGWQLFGRSKSAVEIDAAALGFYDLRHFGGLRQREAVPHGVEIGCSPLPPTVPPHLPPSPFYPAP